MALPLTATQYAELRAFYRLSEFQGRLCAQCRHCAQVYLVSRALLGPTALAGLMAHAEWCIETEIATGIERHAPWRPGVRHES